MMMKTRRPAALAVLTLLAGLSAAGQAQAQETRRSYIVQLVDAPAANYTGGAGGRTATKSSTGRLDLSAAHVQSYISYLDQQQDAVLATLSNARPTHRYNVVFNGFAARLTDAEVRALKRNPAVANISADAIKQLDTNYTPTFLGLDKVPGGLWEQLGGPQHAGEDMIIGMLDSGIWPESPSFADRVDNSTGEPTHSLVNSTQVYGPPPAKWKGGCDLGEGLTAANCNNKLIGLKAFKDPLQTLAPLEFNSARDAVQGGGGGHGSHTASTAGGNGGVPATSGGSAFGKVSGIAPRARVAAYKVCWTDGITLKSGCSDSNTVAAVEQAVRDGVDVLNYSIGPTAGGGTFTDPSELAFLGASNAGVFVAASAGNAGPATGPAANLGPWHATVGNSTHNRLNGATATLGNGAKYVGASLNTTALPQTTLILSTEAKAAAASVSDANLCFPNSLDPAKVTGKVVACTRGTNARVEKSAVVAAAGGVGMLLLDNGAGVVSEAHSVPTVHLYASDAPAVRTYAAGAAGTSAISTWAATVGATPAPVMNGSSSRGPNVANANILKPDVTGPGTDVLATVSPNLDQAARDAIAAGGATTATNFAFYTGTSMSSPHVAGLAALLKQQHPSWTPAMIKSALMTTGKDTFSDGRNGALPWDTSAKDTGKLPWAQGAGHVTPNDASNPGLVYDAGELDYKRFLCGINAGVYDGPTCVAAGTIPAYNLNLASLTAAAVLGSTTLTRTVTNVGNATATYNAVAAVPGFDVLVSPSSLTLAPGAKASFTVKLTRSSAAIDTWAYGALTWSDGSRVVRSPLTARAALLSAPNSVSSETTSGSKVFTLGTGYSGSLSAAKGGLNEAARDTRSIGKQPDTTNTAATCKAGGGQGINVHTVSVAPGAMVARFALYNEETTGGANSDLDLLVFKADGTQVGSSGTGGSTELVQLSSPAAGDYKVCVVGYDPEGGTATYTLSSWVVNGGVGVGNLKVLAPGKVSTGGSASIGLSWSGLSRGKRHLGAISYVGNGTMLGTTLVEINTNDPLPTQQVSRVARPQLD
ncbi:S8 family peptidase [Paucibacter sp. Y2R2-4]|uniref:S8 family peptidase n=1 Tax=Paucibacter sp. Y2R2-4 TaxID=2893553 RepID=UPI002962064C|nr:S8 family peptidase [Paucibacter sp. Y2R2-4]